MVAVCVGLIVARRPAIVAPYVARIIKDMALYLQSRLRNGSSSYYIGSLNEFNKLVGDIVRTGHLIPIEYLTRLKSVLSHHCPQCAAICDALCHTSSVVDAVNSGNFELSADVGQQPGVDQ